MEFSDAIAENATHPSNISEMQIFSDWCICSCLCTLNTGLSPIDQSKRLDSSWLHPNRRCPEYPFLQPHRTRPLVDRPQLKYAETNSSGYCVLWCSLQTTHTKPMWSSPLREKAPWGPVPPSCWRIRIRLRCWCKMKEEEPHSSILLVFRIDISWHSEKKYKQKMRNINNIWVKGSKISEKLFLPQENNIAFPAGLAQGTKKT